MNRGIYALAIGTFALGIAEFSMMGILEDVARDLDISVVKAGHLISAYSTGVAIGAPALLLLRRVPLRRLMVILAVMILLGNACAALSPGFFTLLASRFISGLPHGAFFGAGAIVCSRLSEPGRGPMAVAVMVSGMTVANLVGVPGSVWLCNTMSWRIPFAVVALAGLTAAIFIHRLTPRLDALPDHGLKSEFHFLRSPAPWLIYAGVFFGQASVYCWLSYISPIMINVAGYTADAMTWIMVVVGAGMVVGNLVAGRAAVRIGAARSSMILCLGAAVVMLAMYFAASLKVPSVVLSFMAAACLFGLGGPLQYLIVRYSKGGEMLGGAGIQIAFNVSNAMAAAVGGLVINMGFGLQATAPAGIPFALIGAVALFIMQRRYGNSD